MTWPTENQINNLFAVSGLDHPPVIEHAIQMSGGGMHVRYNHPDLEKVYPLEQWIKHSQRFGGKVYRRRILVIEDWTEVPKEDLQHGQEVP